MIELTGTSKRLYQIWCREIKCGPCKDAALYLPEDYYDDESNPRPSPDDDTILTLPFYWDIYTYNDIDAIGCSYEEFAAEFPEYAEVALTELTRALL